MEKSNVYDKKKIQNYISMFLTLRQNYLVIEESCEAEAIVEIFYNKLQPVSLAEDMKFLKIKDVKKSVTALLENLQSKDIQLAENNREKSSQPVSKQSQGEGKKECLNCIHNKKEDATTNHKLWWCKNIDFCFKCNKKHLAFGPDCKFKDLKVFNYEQYIEKKRNPSNSIKSGIKNTGSSYANVTTSQQPACTDQPTNS